MTRRRMDKAGALFDGDVIGIDRYGASAPYKTIFEHYGLTARRVADKAKSLIK